MAKQKSLKGICEKCTWPIINAPFGSTTIVIDDDGSVPIDFGFTYDPKVHKTHVCRRDLCIICHGGTPFEQVAKNPDAYTSWLKICKKCLKKLDKRKRSAMFYY